MEDSHGREREWRVYVWSAWCVVAVCLTVSPLLQHIEYFRSPGEQYYRLIKILVPLLFAFGITYGFSGIRERLRRFELPAAATAAIVLPSLYHPRAVFIVAVFTVSAALVGSFVCRRALPQAQLSAVERLGLALAAGFGLFGFALFLLGLLGALGVATYTALLALPVLIFRGDIAVLGRDLKALSSAWNSEELSHPLVGVGVFFAAVFGALALAVIIAPPLAYDSLRMHLPLARHYAEQGALVALPFHGYSYMPQSIELLQSLGYSLGGRSAAEMISPVLAVPTFALLAAIARLAGASRRATVVGIIAVATVPFLHWTFAVPKNDGAIATFQLAALLCCLRARQSEPRAAPWLLACSFFLAMSFAVKHVALYGAVPISLLMIQPLWKLKAPIRTIAWVAGIFAVFALGWHARAYWLTGNPVYPFYLSDAVEAASGSTMRGLVLEPIPYWKVPWHVHFGGLEGVFESPSTNPFGFFLVFSWPVWLLTWRWARGAEAACLFYLVVYFLYWASLAPIARYAIAPLAIFCVLTAGRADQLLLRTGKWCSATVCGAFALICTFGVLPTMIMEINGPQLQYLAGRVGQHEYLRRTLVTYPALEFVANNARPDDGVASIDACSLIYAHNVARYRCHDLVDDEGDAKLPAIIRGGEYRFIVLPADRWPDPELAQAAPQVSTVEVYRDDHFRVIELLH